MFSEVFENRLRSWRQVRERINNSDFPFDEVIAVYNKAPVIHNKSIDMWNNKTWLDPWQLIKENGYTETCIICGICYTLQLTERFSHSEFEIHITTNNETKETFLLLAVDDTVIQPQERRYLKRSAVPNTWISQKIYSMPAIH
jgi:hypothetical protein